MWWGSDDSHKKEEQISMRKARWLALSIAMLLVLAACGGDEADGGDGDTATTVAEDKPVVNVFGAFSGV